jgi:hypothetical protein
MTTRRLLNRLEHDRWKGAITDDLGARFSMNAVGVDKEKRSAY